MKPTLVSGIQPTGKLHIGNYLGALQNFVELQNSGKYRCYFMVADLHSLTENYNPKDKPSQVRDVVLDFLAAGIDPRKSIIFIQSEVPAHSELTWILNTITPFGELRRMTQFKDKGELNEKSKKDLILNLAKDIGYKNIDINMRLSEILREVTKEESVNVGLFDYPVLMACDILLYDAGFVPVGDDQDQHLELARTLARRFNNRFGKTFVEPEALHTSLPRVMSLDDPKKKMSKSRPAGCLFLDDSPEIIQKKIMSATTDSGKEIKYDPEKKPGISNLIQIYGGIVNYTTRAVERKFEGTSYAEFKKSVAEETIKFLAPFQKKKKEVVKNAGLMNKTIAAGNKKANAAASKKMIEVKKKIGLLH